MALLLLKLTLTPVLIGAASLAARRWGPSIGGWLVALPLTSGPVALYLALDHGTAFAAGAARGSMAGLLGDAVFALGYGWLARRHGWLVSMVGGFGCFALAASASQPFLGGSPAILFVLVMAAMAVCLRFAPPTTATATRVSQPAWDILARMVIGTLVVLAVTEAATFLGPQLSGIVAAFPVYVTILAVFAHRLEGPEQAVGVTRGLQVGLFGTVVFFLVISAAIEPVGIAGAFGIALVAVAAVQSVSLRLLKRPIPATVNSQ